MTTTAPAGRRRIPARWIAAAAIAVLVVLMAVDTEYRTVETAAAAAPKKFDPAAFGAQNYQAKVVPAIQAAAVDLPVLLKALADDKDAAGQKYGKRQGTGPYTFAVKATGKAGQAKSGLLPVTVKGLPDDTRVSLQTGPAINGTALRDAAGFITFGQFTNQVEYADAATALNNEMRDKLLKGLDVAALDGKDISFVGAFTLLTPQTVTITPVAIS
jgi:predicted lipoprotein